MRMNRTWFTLLVCLLGVVAGWLLAHISSNLQEETSPVPAVKNPVSVADEATSAASSREPRHDVPVQRVKESRVIYQVADDPVFENPGSPVNSQDLDKNREWARTFPEEASNWLLNAPDGNQRIAIAEIVCPELAQTDVEAAVALAEDCLGGGTNSVAQNLLDNLAQQWAEQDVQAASDWALAKPEGEQRDRLLQRIAVVESQSNPVRAAGLVVLNMSPGPLMCEAAISVLHQWAQQDAAAALIWAEAFPPGELRTRAINEVNNVSAYSAEGQAFEE